jgi:uncharacterized Zn-binding protein involved in type VI secretion
MTSKLGMVTTALAATALAVPGAAAANGGGQQAQTLKLIARETESQFLDLGPSGLGAGDQFTFADALSRDGRPVGVDGGSCTITSVDSYDAFTANCVATLRLRGGQIAVQGLVSFADNGMRPFTVAITGGTGAYRGASGEMDIRPVTDTKEIYILRLDRR